MGLDGLGLEVMGQSVGGGRTVLACKVVGEDRWCRRCGCQGEARDTVIRRPAHEPYGWRPTILHVSVRRYRCQTCAHVWRQNMSAAADPRAKLSRAAVRWALMGLVVHHLTVARIADVLAVSWNTANTAILGEGQRILIDDPDRFDGVRVIGVDEHVWRHTPYGDKYVTVILDLTPIRERSGPLRLLDMIPGRSKKVFHTRSCLLTPRQQHRILDLFASDCHVALEVTWSVYQNIIDAYRDPNKIRGKALMKAEINTLTCTRVPRGLTELITLGRTLKRRAGDTPGLLRPPPHHRRSHRSHQRTPRTPTRIRTRTCETSPTTSPEHSSKQEDSNPNYTPNYEEPYYVYGRPSEQYRF